MMTTDDRLLTRELLASYDVARLLTTLARKIAHTAAAMGLDLSDVGVEGDESLMTADVLATAAVDNSEGVIWECAVSVMRRAREVS